VIHEVLDAVKQWPDYAKQAGIGSNQAKHIIKQHRLHF
jgi:hypothetical protein